MNRVMLCNTCGRWYWVSPTGYLDEWQVELMTGETVKRITMLEPTILEVVQSALTGTIESQWKVAEYTPIQVQASVHPLCHIPECAMSGELVETERIVL